MVGTGIICLFMATFMSHTATASLLIPIIAVVGVNMGDNLAPMGALPPCWYPWLSPPLWA